MDISQSLQDLLSSDKFDTPPRIDGNNGINSSSSSSNNNNDIKTNKRSEKYENCNRQYIIGNFIQVLIDINTKYGLFDKEDKEDREIWDLLLYKTISSMDKESIQLLRETHIELSLLISDYLTKKFDQIVIVSSKSDDNFSSIKKPTIEYTYSLIQSYYIWKYLFNNNNNNNNNNNKQYKSLKNFNNIVKQYIRYLPNTRIDNIDKESIYNLIDFYIFELELNGLHKVKSIALYDCIFHDKELNYISNTHFEKSIVDRLTARDNNTKTATVTTNKKPLYQINKQDTRINTKNKEQLNNNNNNNNNNTNGNNNNNNDNNNNNNNQNSLVKSTFYYYQSMFNRYIIEHSHKNKNLIVSLSLLSIVLLLISLIKRKNQLKRSLNGKYTVLIKLIKKISNVL